MYEGRPGTEFLQRFCYAAFAPKNNLVACSRGQLSLREASSCDRQFILNPSQSLRVVEVPETSEKPTPSFRIQNRARKSAPSGRTPWDL